MNTSKIKFVSRNPSGPEHVKPGEAYVVAHVDNPATGARHYDTYRLPAKEWQDMLTTWQRRQADG